MPEITLEGTSKSIELASCKAGEFSIVWDQALRYLQAASDEDCSEIAEEVVSTWLSRDGKSNIDPTSLTMDDIWSILQAKAGRAKAPVLAKLPEIAAEAVGFFGQNGLAPVIQAMESTITQTGDDT